jgi:hypothetical protein
MASRLRLHDMHLRHRALTPAIAGCYQEAASVCFQRHHSSPTEIRISDNNTNSSAQVEWEAPDSRTSDAWANETDTTEAGAYGCVIASVELVRNLMAVRRAETGTGADYYVGPDGAGVDDLEDCLRLEVSGVNDGDEKAVRKRLLEKVVQAQRGNSSLPAIAGVIGFSERLVLLKDVPEES